MSTLSDPPKEGFKISQLIYDTRYRSMTIQVIALILFLLAVGWLATNAARNLAELGKPLGFGFLAERAGYDINQKLIEYNSDSSHIRAAFAGVLNTLLVAFLGCLTATVVGVLIGVLRLSKNWLISKMMTIYIEGFRNVPVLLWILVVFGIMIEVTPPPKAFKGENPEAAMTLFDSVAITNQGVFIPRLSFTEFGWGYIIALLIAIFGIRWITKKAKAKQIETGIYPHTFLYKLAAFMVPLLACYFISNVFTKNQDRDFLVRSSGQITTLADMASADERFDYCLVGGNAGSLKGLSVLEEAGVTVRRKKFVTEKGALSDFSKEKCNVISVRESEADEIMAQSRLDKLGTDGTISRTVADFTTGNNIQVDTPELTKKGIPRFEGGTHIRNSLIALWFALSLYTAAFIAETVRSGIQAISKGQTEAAAALGLRSGRIMSLVVLPQALRVIIPPMISQYLNLTKNSSLAIAVGYMDITGTLGGITLNQTGREMECLIILMAIYLVISLTISGIMNWYNERVKLKER